MWQRIQTVFLGITIVTLIISLILPVWQGQAEDTTVVLTPFYLSQKGQYTYWPYSLTAMLVVAGITLALIEIRRYDNRILQIKMGTLNSLILMGVMISAVWQANTMINAHPANWDYGLGLYIPFVGVTCNWLAVRFIRRDEKLVRDSDRIR